MKKLAKRLDAAENCMRPACAERRAREERKH